MVNWRGFKRYEHFYTFGLDASVGYFLWSTMRRAICFSSYVKKIFPWWMQVLSRRLVITIFSRRNAVFEIVYDHEPRLKNQFVCTKKTEHYIFYPVCTKNIILGLLIADLVSNPKQLLMEINTWDTEKLSYLEALNWVTLVHLYVIMDKTRIRYFISFW